MLLFRVLIRKKRDARKRVASELVPLKRVKDILGEQGWRSVESARLPPMWPGFNSRTRRQMWVEFVVGSLPCSERFFSGFSGFLLSSKTNISKFQFDLDYCKALCHEPLARVIVQALPMFDIKFKLTFFMLINVGVNNCEQSI